MSLLNLEFLATTHEDLRYVLEKNGHGRQKAFARDGLSMHTLLKVTELLKVFPGDDNGTSFLAFSELSSEEKEAWPLNRREAE